MQKREPTTSKRIVTTESFQQTCRICFTEGKLYDTRTSMYEDHTIEELFEDLINVTELKIPENYMDIVYPQFICYRCIEYLIFTKLFLNQCYKAHKTLSKVYAYLTLYQHQSVIISKPMYLYKTLNAIMTPRCKLEIGTPLMSGGLRRALSRKDHEAHILNKGEQLEIKEDQHDLRIKKNNLKRKAANSDRIKTTKKRSKIAPEKAKCRKRAKSLPKSAPSKVESKKQETVQKRTVRKRRQKSTKVSNKLSEQIIDPDFDFERFQNELAPEFNDVYSFENDQKLAELYAMHLENLKKQQNIELIRNNAETPGTYNCIEKTDRSEETKINTFDAIDIKQEPRDDNLDNLDDEFNDLMVDINLTETIKEKFEKFDTVKLSRALADINRDCYNIELDHSYTDNNDYKNLRYIMPRLNFQRVNDLLYPSPAIARKKDKVLAGNISKRMASILSGTMEKRGGTVESNLDETVTVKMEPRDLIDNDEEIGGFVTPEYVEINAEDFDLIHMIKQEPIEGLEEM